MKTKVLLLIGCMVCCLSNVLASEPDSVRLSRWHVGIGTGYHANMMRFHGLPKYSYKGRDAKHSGLFQMSAEYDLSKTISVRPELAFLSRGGKQYMHNIGVVREGVYSLKASYFDIRVPIIYNFHLNNNKLRPYVYLSPLAGFAMNGKINLNEELWNGQKNEYELKLTNGNMASAYFALVIGGGVKYPLEIAGFAFNVGVEFSYEYGVTDTYSKKERNNDVIIVNNANGPLASPRKFSGFELKFGVQVPLTSFKKRPKAKPIIEEPIAPPVVEKPKDKPCYTLQEIQQMVAKGEDVAGKTICSVDDINFDTSQSLIKDASRAYLKQVADVLIETGMSVKVKGHTDSTGSEEFNITLSKNRALAVVKYLADLGVEWEKISYDYFGESQPLETNDTPEGRRINRRVEFELLKNN